MFPAANKKAVTFFVAVIVLLVSIGLLVCHEKATLKGEFSNKPLTETLVLRAEFPCRDFKKQLLLRSLSVVDRKVLHVQLCHLWIVPALSAQSNHLLL